MTETRLRTIFALIALSFANNVVAVSVVDHYPNDEYVIEHQVTYEEAIAEARKLTLYPGRIPGCKECTSVEMTYCRDESVLNDHCCCDASYNKVFPFVEHTCRVGRQPCKVLAGDCAEYTRLRECCCHSYLASLWKYMAGDGSTRMSSINTIVGVFAMLFILERFLL